jgi:hypothetical protein
LKENPFCGIAIPKRLIPKIYKRKYGINNLWKYNLPGALILEWLSHKEYERRFKYQFPIFNVYINSMQKDNIKNKFFHQSMRT